MTHKCDHPYADSLCGRHAKSRLWNSKTGDTVHRCRTHGDMLQNADPSWMDAEVASAIRERDRAVDVAKGNLRVAAERLGHDARPMPSLVALEALYDAARELVVAETARREILRETPR